MILSKREEELRHALRHNLGPAKIQKAAERVRTARLHLIKALHYPNDFTQLTRDSTRFRALEKKRDMWEQRSTESIIKEYSDAGGSVSYSDP